MMFHNRLGQVTFWNNSQTTVITVCILKVDTATDNSVCVRAEVEVVLMPVYRGAAIWQLGKELGAEYIDVGTDECLNPVKDFRLLGEI